MPRKATREEIQCTYFRWKLFQVERVFHADGRSNVKHNFGRPSLGTRDRNEALEQLKQLDFIKACEVGLAKQTDPVPETIPLTLEEGKSLYLAYVGRPPVQGGASESTQKRYRAVLNKFDDYAVARHVFTWQAVSTPCVEGYGKMLYDADYFPSTLYLELTTIKQVVKFLIERGHLPPSAAIKMKLKKVYETSTYCYTAEEVVAIVEKCKENVDTAWLADIIIALVTTGTRIGELAQLRWSAVNLSTGFIQLVDTSRQVKRSDRDSARTTKSHRNRSLAIDPDLMPILQTLKHHPDGYVFHGPRGGRLKPDTVLRNLQDDILSALADRFPASPGEKGIKNGTVRSFRHFFCSRAADSGMSEQLLMSWMGHRESAMVRRYYHMKPEEAKRQMERLPRLFGDRDQSSSA